MRGPRDAAHGTDEPGEGHMTDAQARARVWTLWLAALVGAYMALAVLLTVAVLRVVLPRSTDQR